MVGGVRGEMRQTGCLTAGRACQGALSSGIRLWSRYSGGHGTPVVTVLRWSKYSGDPSHGTPVIRVTVLRWSQQRRVQPIDRPQLGGWATAPFEASKGLKLESLRRRRLRHSSGPCGKGILREIVCVCV